MSNQNGNANQKTSSQVQEQLEPEYTEQDLAKYNEAIDAINDVGNKQFMRLPSETGAITVQFFRDKRKMELVTRKFTDKQTGNERLVKRVKYRVLDPEHKDEGERDLEVPMTLAKKIEKNRNHGHFLLELSREGTGLRTTYDAISVG